MSDEKTTPATDTPPKDARKTVYINRLSLFAANNSDGKAPRLAWSVFDGNPRLEVWTNEKNDEKTNYGKITAPIDSFTAGVIAEMLIGSEKKENGWREKIVNRSTWHNGQKFNEPTRINDIIIGKDNEGTVYISIHEDNRPNIRFFFGPSQWHTLVRSDGSPISRQELSVMYARAYGEMVRATVATIIGYGCYVSAYADHDTGQEKPVFSRGGGGQNSNYQNNQNRGSWQGGGGNYQKGNWQNRNQGGGGYQKGNWQNRNQGGGGGYQNRQQQQDTSQMADDDIAI